MAHAIRCSRTDALVIAAVLALPAAVAIAQQTGPVAAMFNDDQKRAQTLAASFLPVEVPATKTGGSPLRVYLSAGNLERAFDESNFRPDAAIVPTNTDLLITASSPATQRVLIERVEKQADVMRDLQDQIATRRKQSLGASGDESALLPIGEGTFVAQLPRASNTKPGDGAFPRAVCLISTDFPEGGAIDRRELFAQDRVRKGIAACLTALEAQGVQSLVMPLIGAASSGTQARDEVYEGQRLLKECRLLNAIAGIALGIHDYAPGRRGIREIGIVQWDEEISGMFSVPRGSRLEESAQAAYRTYAEQVKVALRKGLVGEKMTPADVGGTCNAIFNAQ